MYCQTLEHILADRLYWIVDNNNLFSQFQASFRKDKISVQFFNVFRSSWRFTQGFSQGSVLVSLLFLFYITSLASSLNDNEVIALFANTVPILTAARKAENAVAAQSVVNSDLIWSQEWKLDLNTNKSEVGPFST